MIMFTWNLSKAQIVIAVLDGNLVIVLVTGETNAANLLKIVCCGEWYPSEVLTCGR